MTADANAARSGSAYGAQAPAGLDRRMLLLMIVAATILLVTMGMRQTLSLYIKPIIADTGIGYAAMSSAFAMGQLVWGVAQPTFGALADRYGAQPALIAGALLLAAGAALTPFVTNEFTVTLTIGMLIAAGAGAGSFGILMGVVAQSVPAAKRSFASGFVNAGGSLGQFMFAPLSGLMISMLWWNTAMGILAVLALLTIPLAMLLVRTRASIPVVAPLAAAAPATLTLGEQLRLAARDRSYWCLHAGFFTCGFHISFLVTHLPKEVELCSLPASVASGALAIIGLANVAGSLWAGWAGGVVRMKWLLFAMYFSRAVAVLIYMAMPRTSMTFYVFAAVLGFTWLATVPPTAGLIGKLFGVRYLATLFGLATLTHQVGGYLGAKLGGIALTRFGDFSWMWYADAALALTAALINLPIREAPVRMVAARV